MSETTDAGALTHTSVPADEPAEVRRARAELGRIAGSDLPTRIAGYDEVHRLLRESMTALDARPSDPPDAGTQRP